MELDSNNTIMLTGDTNGNIIYSDLAHSFDMKKTIKVHGNKEPITDIR